MPPLLSDQHRYRRATSRRWSSDSTVRRTRGQPLTTGHGRRCGAGAVCARCMLSAGRGSCRRSLPPPASLLPSGEELRHPRRNLLLGGAAARLLQGASSPVTAPARPGRTTPLTEAGVASVSGGHRPQPAQRAVPQALLAGVVTAGGLHAVDAGALSRARELEAIGFQQLTLAAGGKISWTGGFGLVT